MTRNKMVIICWGSILLMLFVFGCSSKQIYSPPSRSQNKNTPATQRPYTIQGKTYHPMPSAEGYREIGFCSWYGPNFHGKRTSNGEVYDMEDMTAAHKLLPMNTYVRVTNLDNGRQAVLRINDRGPFVDGRIIDLSKAAARQLDVLGPGTARVEVEALGFKKAGSGQAGRPVEYEPPASYEEGVFTVQVGAFTDERNAQRLASSLRPTWGEVFVIKYDRGDEIFFRVRVNKLNRLEDAQALQLRLRTSGQDQSFAIGW